MIKMKKRKLLTFGLCIIVFIFISLGATADNGYINTKFLCSETGTNCADLSSSNWAAPYTSGDTDRIAVTSGASRTGVLEADDSGNYLHVGSETAHDFQIVRNDVQRVALTSSSIVLRNSSGDTRVTIADTLSTWSTPGSSTGSSRIELGGPSGVPGFAIFASNNDRANIACADTGLGFAAGASSSNPGYSQLFLEASADVGIYDITPDARLDILNTGTGYSLRVDDSAEPDSSPFIVNTAGNVAIGTSSLLGKLRVAGDEMRVGSSGTVSWATGDGDLYVQGDIEVQGRGAIVGWAEINAAGTVVSCWNCNTNTAETQKVLTGRYEVDFTPISTNIDAYPRLAVYDEHSATGVTYSVVTLADRGGDDSSVWVAIYNSDTGVYMDQDFTLVIFSQ